MDRRVSHGQKCLLSLDNHPLQSVLQKLLKVNLPSEFGIELVFIGLESPLVLKTQASRLAERAREESERNGNVVLSLCMANLFAMKKSLTVETTESVKSLVNCRLTISLKSPLMPEKLRRELNPMTITVISANNLPDVPTGYSELQEKFVNSYNKLCNYLCCCNTAGVIQLMLAISFLPTTRPSGHLDSHKLLGWSGSRAGCFY